MTGCCPTEATVAPTCAFARIVKFEIQGANVPSNLEKWDITKEETTLGRHQEENSDDSIPADFHVGLDKKISRVHARIRWNIECQLFELSCHGRNGVMIDGMDKRLMKDEAPFPLQSTTGFQISNVRMYFLLAVSNPKSLTAAKLKESRQTHEPPAYTETLAYEQPKKTYAEILTDTLHSASPSGLNFDEVFRAIESQYPYYQQAGRANSSWRGTIRKILNSSDRFERIVSDEKSKPKYRLATKDRANPSATLSVTPSATPSAILPDMPSLDPSSKAGDMSQGGISIEEQKSASCTVDAVLSDVPATKRSIDASDDAGAHDVPDAKCRKLEPAEESLMHGTNTGMASAQA